MLLSMQLLRQPFVNFRITSLCPNTCFGSLRFVTRGAIKFRPEALQFLGLFRCGRLRSVSGFAKITCVYFSLSEKVI